MSRRLRVIVVAAVAASTLIALLLNGFVRFNYPSEGRYPIRGIDVSHHQGAVDWAQVGQAGFAFAYIKATEGIESRDRRFDDNWAAADAAGVQRGAYHFFTFCSAGAPQARNFIEVVRPRQRMLPPAVDVEFDGNCANPPPIETMRAELSEFLTQVQAAYSVAPLIYATRNAYAEILSAHFAGYAIWARNVFCEPRLADGRDWLLWQYADRGRVPGVSTLVDLNVFRGDPEEFEVFAGGRRLISSTPR